MARRERRSWRLGLLGALPMLALLGSEVTAVGPVRPPAVAGQFYPNDARTLGDAVRGYLESAQPVDLDGRLVALLAPHAGYMYSGPVAGWAYRQVKDRALDTVVVLAPSHRVAFRGVSVWPKGAYRTPLGDVLVDEETCRAILGAGWPFNDLADAHGPEHALEVQIPFLQVALQPGWRLVPVIMGSPDLATAQKAAQAIGKAMEGKRALIIASSDLSHFHGAGRAEELDRKAIRHMEAVDPDSLWEEIQAGKTEACGIGPVLVSLAMARAAGARRGTLLRYAHSGDISGERSRVVGYAAMAWTAPARAGATRSAPGIDLGLTGEERQTLKSIARSAIQCALEGRPLPAVEGITPTLMEPRGAFVTLEKNRQLRGCIGFIEAVKPLHETVREMAEAAAFRDPRFPALRQEEWPQIQIEISVLTPLRQIRDVEEIRVGVHGLYVIQGSHRGLLLPQVATDYGWDRETFLAHTCTKAGLPKDAWKDPQTRIYVFGADVF